jgi:hypothetical protein
VIGSAAIEPPCRLLNWREAAHPISNFPLKVRALLLNLGAWGIAVAAMALIGFVWWPKVLEALRRHGSSLQSSHIGRQSASTRLTA